MSAEKKKGGLGRGLGALLQDAKNNEAGKDIALEQAAKALPNQAGVVIYIPLSQIEVNPFQPRTTFDEEMLKDLSESIKVHGVIQPITVRKIENNKYQLIAGERRLRASKLAGKTEIPSYVRLASDQESIEIALIENIQREDLNALEIAINYKRLMDECSLTQEQLSERVGKSRSSVANLLRLLKLPPDMQAALRDNTITLGHAKALLGIDYLPTLLSLFKETVSKNLSVRQTEELVKTSTEKPAKKADASTKPVEEKTVHLRKLQDEIASTLETKVVINRTNDGKGEISIKFYNDVDLNRLVEVFRGLD
ncbi:MAG TPA: ParB/RepB/Spo0J family partition protein [Chitinophagales bacterium]